MSDKLHKIKRNLFKKKPPLWFKNRFTAGAIVCLVAELQYFLGSSHDDQQMSARKLGSSNEFN